MLGIVHGDIKPSNLIMADERTVKLSDFGLAQTDSSSPTQGISGTLSYMAPELSQGQDPSDRSDMYSLGVTLFELSFGRRPYDVCGTTLRQQISSQQEAEIRFPEKWPNAIPERWRAVLARLLAKNPAERYPDYAALEQDLDQLAPVGVTTAGLLNRGLAWIVDLVVQGTVLLPFWIAAMLPTVASSVQLPATIQPLVESVKWLGAFAVLVPAAFAWMEWRGWRTVGRYLFQLRVADAHGLWLSGRKRALRSVIRNLPIWVSAISTILVLLHLDILAILLAPVDDVVLLVNILPVLGPRRLALHDRLFGSHVVLDTVRK